MKHLTQQRGVTLTEIVLVIGIAGAVVVGAITASNDSFRLGDIFSGNLSSLDDARRLLRPMASELRAMLPGEDGRYAIQAATETELTFFSDVDHDGDAERVRYFVESGTLKKGVIQPSGNPIGYTGSESVAQLIKDVTNSGSEPVFTFFDSDYNGQGSPLAFPVTIADVRLVKIDITIDKTTLHDPPPVTVSTQVSIRNLKDNYESNP